MPETGVDGEKANSWEYCKRWIDRAEPFFVCMLGQRYGCVPKPHEIKDDDRKHRIEGILDSKSGQNKDERFGSG